MSYTSELKSYLCGIEIKSNSERSALLLGILLGARSFCFDEIELKSECKDTIMLTKRLIESLFFVPDNALVITEKGLFTSIYLGDKRFTSRILNFYGYSPDDVFMRVKGNFSDAETGALLRGLFLSCGSIQDPEKSYHLELVFSHRYVASDIKDRAEQQAIPFKKVERKGQHVLYLKESTQIEDILTLIGAPQASLSIMGIKVMKDIRNNVNRITNCEAANIDKQVTASLHQIEDIKLIASVNGLSSLPPVLEQTARIRLDNPDMSLLELCGQFPEKISKSGLNHRLSRIKAIADTIRELNKGTNQLDNI